MREKIVIPVTIKKGRELLEDKEKKIKVCAYVRVSTDFKEQIESFNSQIARYTRIIKEEHADNWEFVGIFTDEKSGKSAAAREGFNQMMEACRQHKIDLILCKQMSRFARNTIDSLKAIYELRHLGVEIFFEEDNLYGSNTQFDFNISMYSAFAQEESRQISVRVSAGIKERLQSGKIDGFLREMFGLRKDKDKNLYIYEPEAIYVRMIFNLFINGVTAASITDLLTRDVDPSDCVYNLTHKSLVYRTLRNLRYKGDIIFQKKFMQSHLDKHATINKGQRPKYLYKDVNAKIIPEAFFDKATNILNNHRETLIEYTYRDLIFCSECHRQLCEKGENKHKIKRMYFSCNYNANKIQCHNYKYIESETLINIISGFIKSTVLNQKNIKIIKNIVLNAVLPSLGSAATYKKTFIENKLNELSIQKMNLDSLVLENPRILQSDKYYEKVYENDSSIKKFTEDLNNLNSQSKTDEWHLNREIKLILNDRNNLIMIVKALGIKIIKISPFEYIFVNNTGNILPEVFQNKIDSILEKYKTINKETSICVQKNGKLHSYLYGIIDYNSI